jgi:hypothetical protein
MKTYRSQEEPLLAFLTFKIGSLCEGKHIGEIIIIGDVFKIEV